MPNGTTLINAANAVESENKDRYDSCYQEIRIAGGFTKNMMLEITIPSEVIKEKVDQINQAFGDKVSASFEGNVVLARVDDRFAKDIVDFTANTQKVKTNKLSNNDTEVTGLETYEDAHLFLAAINSELSANSEISNSL